MKSSTIRGLVPMQFMKVVCLLISILTANSLYAQQNDKSIHVNRNDAIRNYTPTELVEKIFVKGGSCSSVSNVNLRSHGWDMIEGKWTDSDNRGLGYFTNGGSNFEMKEGLILSTGGLSTIEGPNSGTREIESSSMSGGVSIPEHDSDLATLGAGTVRNVSVLEFNFVPISNVITFRYVFASEEYSFYANTSYNDVFGFFISGPGIPGEKQNIARLPYTTTGTDIVSINNVNNGKLEWDMHNCPPGSNPKNNIFYINIPVAFSDCKDLTLQEQELHASMEFNGRTVELTATCNVIPCETYHLKLAIGNVGDMAFQSGVFLEAQSFSTSNLEIINYVDNVMGMDSVYRGSTNNKFVISRAYSDDSPLDVSLTYGGTVVNGSDILQLDGSPLPASISIDANQQSVEIPYKVNTSSTGDKTFTITTNCLCGGEAGTPKTLYIYDAPLVSVSCNACPASFAPIPGKKYIFSGWVKDSLALENGAASYEGCSARLVFDLVGTDTKYEKEIIPSGSIIDGWQRMQDVFEVPANAYKMRLELINETDSDDVFFDDIRVYPFNGNMKSYVYDPVTRRLAAELDDENYATIYEYDEEGALVRIKKETERGVMTIREARQSKPKK
jgi:hypothetical protein